MCGIFGGVNVDFNEAKDCINLIKRGEDGITIKKINDKIVFASRRHLVKKSGYEEDNKNLSDQPYFSKDKKIALIFNGEFFNFNDYKKDLEKKNVIFNSEGDTEVFLKLYETKGINFLNDKKIDSLFAIAIVDLNIGKIFITRDWPGRVPLYYYKSDKKFIFSSELKAFKKIKNLSLQDPVELEPGSIIEYDIEKNEIKQKKFFKPLTNLISKSENEIHSIAKSIDQKLDESAKNRTMGDVPICTMLSGGIDSVLTTFYVFKNIDFKKVSFQPKSYVFFVDGFNSQDLYKAREAANGFEEIGLQLQEVKASKEKILNDLPNIIHSFEMRKIKSLSFYPLPIYWYLAPEMRKDGFKVTIGGHGVDELLGAYDSWKELNKPHELQIRTISRLAFINNIYYNMLKRASIIFMNRGPIEARFPFLNQNICEYLLSVDKKWLTLNKDNAKVMVSLIEKNSSNKLEALSKLLDQYLKNEDLFYKNNSEEIINNIKKIFWKFPLIVSSFYASKRSFLKFENVFNPKLRGQHGAGITSLENDIVKKYANLGKSDKEIFSNIANSYFS